MRAPTEPARARSASSRRAAASPRRRRPATRRPSAHDSAQNSRSPACSTCRARTRLPSMPSAMSVRRRIVCAGAARVGGVAIAVDQRPLGRRAAVVEHRLADQLDLAPLPSRHSTVRTSRWSASSSAGGRVCGVIVSSPLARARSSARRAPRPSRRRASCQRRDERVRARLVGARRREVDPERPEPERSRPGGRAARRRRWRVEARARTASRSPRRARPARRCGSPTGSA